MNLIIRHSTIAELEASPNIASILEEYAEESSIKGLPEPLAKAKTYKHLETLGAIHIVGAFWNDLLIGYIITIAPVLPHYSIRIAVVESFFVLKDHRKTGAGLKLLRESERYAKHEGALGVLISAPVGGNLAQVLPHVGYAEASTVFFRSLLSE